MRPTPVLSNSSVIKETIVDADDKSKYSGALAGWIIALIILVFLSIALWYLICKFGCISKDAAKDNKLASYCLINNSEEVQKLENELNVKNEQLK